MFEDTIADLNAALKDVKGLRVDPSGLGLVEPPAAFVGPPTLTWSGYSDNPTTVALDCIVYVPADERAVGRMLTFLPLVRDAIESVEDVVVTTATPEVFRSGASDLPAYRLQIEVTH